MWSLLELLTSMERKNETSTIACSSKNDPARRPGGWHGAPEKWQVLGSVVPLYKGSQAVLIMGDRIDQVAYQEYPEEMYPTNCHGTFYLFSAPVRNRLLQVFFLYSYVLDCCPIS